MENDNANLEALRMELSCAFNPLDKVDALFGQCRMLYFFPLLVEGKTISVRPDQEAPRALFEAAAWIAAGRDYVAAIDKNDASQENLNRARRAVTIASVIAARAKACMALVYVAYWKPAPGYRNFEVLGYQAETFNIAATGDNWEYFAAPIFYRPEEPAIDELHRSARVIISHGEASFAYAMCLHTQMQTMFRRDQLPEVEAVKIDLVEPEVMVKLPLTERNDQTVEAFHEWHSYCTGQDLRESYQLFRRPSPPSPKTRLVGFHHKRAGRAHSAKRSRRMRVAK